MFAIVVDMVGGPTTAQEVLELVERARDACGRLDPATVGLHEVVPVFDAMAELEKLAGGAVLLVSQPLGEGIGAGLPAPGSDVVVSWHPDACVLLAE